MRAVVRRPQDEGEGLWFSVGHGAAGRVGGVVDSGHEVAFLHGHGKIDRNVASLSQVEHELGHVLGLADLDALADNLMSGVLESGVRKTPYQRSADATFAAV